MHKDEWRAFFRECRARAGARLKPGDHARTVFHLENNGKPYVLAITRSSSQKAAQSRERAGYKTELYPARNGDVPKRAVMACLLSWAARYRRDAQGHTSSLVKTLALFAHRQEIEELRNNRPNHPLP